jgi:hypothetical protein
VAEKRFCLRDPNFFVLLYLALPDRLHHELSDDVLGYANTSTSWPSSITSITSTPPTAPSPLTISRRISSSSAVPGLPSNPSRSSAAHACFLLAPRTPSPKPLPSDPPSRTSRTLESCPHRLAPSSDSLELPLSRTTPNHATLPPIDATVVLGEVLGKVLGEVLGLVLGEEVLGPVLLARADSTVVLGEVLGLLLGEVPVLARNRTVRRTRGRARAGLQNDQTGP